MSTITIPDTTGVATKDPADIKVYQFDWDTDNLAVGVSISSNFFTIVALHPASDTALTKDQESVLAGLRHTQVRLSGGTLGARYRIDNKIVTNETPAQTKERSFILMIQNK